jgi:hypothetical protein
MGWKTLGVLAVVVLSAAATTTTAAAATPQWHVTELPMPAGLDGAWSDLVAHDGHGGYTALVGAPSGEEIVTWTAGKPTEHGHPAGKQLIRVWGEGRDDALLVGTYDNKLFTMDGSGFHAVPTDQFSFVEWAAVGPHGDILIMADAADGSTSVQHSTLADPGTWQPLPGVTPNSEPIAIDDDGAVLINDSLGSYVLRGGVVQRLSAPGPAAYAPNAVSLKHGVAVGEGWPTADGDTQALEWAAPGYTAQVLGGGVAANDSDAHGLVVGIASGLSPVVWRHGGPVAALPLPAGTDAGTPKFVDDDGTVIGQVYPVQPGGSAYPVTWRH